MAELGSDGEAEEDREREDRMAPDGHGDGGRG